MFDTFQYGVCYYPEHWPTARHESDFRRIKQAGFDLVRMGEGAWGYFEPREGQFQFDLFDRAIDLCRKYGIKVILGTPTYCAPAWVSHEYPEVLRWNFERIPMKHGSRRNFNYTSPKYLELSDRICTALAEHYKSATEVVGWQLDNEFNCHTDVSYAPSDTIAFRQWARRKYKTLDRLNKAWGTAFWSQQYDDWDQIDLPHPTVTYMNPSLLLDETRFISDCVVQFARRQAGILRRCNRKWFITHNGLFGNINGPELTKELDFMSHDQYPLFCEHWTDAAAALLLARSLSFPFTVLEQQSGPGGQMQYLHPTPKPGQIRLWAWQSVGHGAKLLNYFRWRTCPYGSEQHWHGLLDADNKDNRRLGEAEETGKEFRKLPGDFFEARPAKRVGVVRDFDNDANDRRINTYNRSGGGERQHWQAMTMRRHVPCDLVWSSADFRGYELLILPHLKIVSRDLAKKLTKFVQGGGVLVLGAQSGLKDENCHVVEATPPGLLAKLAGVQVQDWTTLGEKETRAAQFVDGREIPLMTFVERLRPTTATAIAFWNGGDSILDQSPAIMRNRVGKGLVIYVGGYCGKEAIQTLLDLLSQWIDLPPAIEAGDAVEVLVRAGKKSSYLVLLNHSNAVQRVSGLEGKELITGKRAGGEIVLAPYEVAVVQRVTK